MAGEDKTLYLIDGSSYLHRAYHAIPRLSNSKGFPTHVALGFTKMILKLLTEKRPKYLAIAFDARGPTFRHRLFEAYKANRPPMPEDLAVQIPVTKEIVRHLNLRMIEKEGVEADDVIGTLARIGEDRGFQVVMVTGDKDFRQTHLPQDLHVGHHEGNGPGLFHPEGHLWGGTRGIYRRHGALRRHQ